MKTGLSKENDRGSGVSDNKIDPWEDPITLVHSHNATYQDILWYQVEQLKEELRRTRAEKDELAKELKRYTVEYDGG